jgi:corrinoid protein of di/trimethylamine methyltransferase
MNNEELLDDIKNAIIGYDKEKVVTTTEIAIKKQINPLKILEKATEGIKIVGEKFHCLEIYLPHLVMAAEAMVAVQKIIEKNLPQEKRVKGQKKVIIGTIQDDIHDIGKNIVFAMLTGSGLEVHDLGKDVSIKEFIEKAKEVEADIIGVSALMTTTMGGQEQLIDELKRLNLRNKFKVLIGGGSTTQEWAEKIGADGYGKDAKEAVEVALRLISNNT